MTILLDTNAFIWWVSDDARLGARARRLIADPTNKVFVSNLSIFECSIKMRLGKLRLDFADVEQELAGGNLRELTYDTYAARQFVRQGSIAQADPFDSAITAQAIAKHITLITGDAHILGSQLEGLHAVDARR